MFQRKQLEGSLTSPSSTFFCYWRRNNGTLSRSPSMSTTQKLKREKYEKVDSSTLEKEEEDVKVTFFKQQKFKRMWNRSVKAMSGKYFKRWFQWPNIEQKHVRFEMLWSKTRLVCSKLQSFPKQKELTNLLIIYLVKF